MKVLVTGANGQLGSEFKFIKSEFGAFEFSFFGKNELDITDAKAVEVAVAGFDAVVNAAAYTAVDRAESEREAAFAINETGALNLALACKKHGAQLVHISTDYVFDGRAFSPLDESAPVSPLGVYGASKLAGERAVLGVGLERSCIIRTSWVYGEFGANFVKTMQRVGRERESVSVVCDQVGTPTNARDLARAVCVALPRLSGGCETYHYSNEGVASWYDFAVAVLGASKVRPIKSSEFKTAAARPFYSVLDKSKIKRELGVAVPHWQESLREFLRSED